LDNERQSAVTRGEDNSVPFKSKAQRRKFAQLLVEGKISDETYEEWNRETGRAKLPERVTPKKKPTAARRAKGVRKPQTGRGASVARRKLRTTRKSQARRKTLSKRRPARRRKSK
jgi:hypothetical protein